MDLYDILHDSIAKAIKDLYQGEINDRQIQLQKTKEEFEGDVTLVVFPFLKISKKAPEATANEIGGYLSDNLKEVEKFNVIKGFLNLVIDSSYYLQKLKTEFSSDGFGLKKQGETPETIMVEYSSPNTNKPLHLGHIRNNLLGWSVCEILKANGKKVIKTNIVNDRGIHICKSMLAWKKWGENNTPDDENIKGDHYVGRYYVKFDKVYKDQINELVGTGQTEEDAKNNAPIILEAREMLRKWEDREPEVYNLWKIMNQWVYQGFDITYKRLGVDFDKIYYESDTYLVGKDSVLEGLKKGLFYKDKDGSVWADLTNEGLDKKILLRSDGTSVYMTQDIGTAQLRQNDFSPDKMVYVVGNEQNYHFKVLSIILDKLGFEWAKDLYHLSYGMVELPEGKMKSREGTVVDADDLMDEMAATAKSMADELGKLDGLEESEKNSTYNMVGMGALKYFLLKVDPSKNMTFNPKESIDFNGNTGPFIQYSHARVCSLIRKASEQGIVMNQDYADNLKVTGKEKSLLKVIHEFPYVVQEAGSNDSPAIIANYIYDLVKEFNQFYHELPILKETDKSLRDFRLHLTQTIGGLIKKGTALLGIEVPERM